ncbi:MAG: hypothetical protein AB8B69_10410 [Chitinophagales bacterium]
MIKLTNDQLALIENYPSDKLSIEEQSLLEDIPNWEEAIRFHQHFLDVIPVFKMEQIKNRLILFEEELKKEKAAVLTKIPDRKYLLDKIKRQIGLSLDELTTLFMPIPNYARVMRSEGLVVNRKLDGTAIIFELQRVSTRSFQVIIEDNLRTPLIKQEIPSNTQRFEISLEDIEQVPGRYYWRAKPNKDLLVGEFFIQKDLMP